MICSSKFRAMLGYVLRTCHEKKVGGDVVQGIPVDMMNERAMRDWSIDLLPLDLSSEFPSVRFRNLHPGARLAGLVGADHDRADEHVIDGLLPRLKLRGRGQMDSLQSSIPGDMSLWEGVGRLLAQAILVSNRPMMRNPLSWEMYGSENLPAASSGAKPSSSLPVWANGERKTAKLADLFDHHAANHNSGSTHCQGPSTTIIAVKRLEGTREQLLLPQRRVREKQQPLFAATGERK